MGSTNCTTDQSLLSASIPCYKDKTNNKIWIRLPHFSGTSPQITGAVVTASTTSSSSSSGSSTAEGRSSLDDEEEIISLALEKDETISLTSETSFVELEESSKVSFDMTTSSGLTESHTLEVDKITDSTITFTIFSEPQTFTLAINEFVVIDLDLDSLNDLKISLVEISNGKANLKFELISDELVNPPIEGEKNASYTWLVVILLVILLTGIIFYFLLRK